MEAPLNDFVGDPQVACIATAYILYKEKSVFEWYGRVKWETGLNFATCCLDSYILTKQ